MDRPIRLSIGEAATASELSVKAIRYYEEIGLIPKAVRTDGGMHTSGRRIYTAVDIGQLRLIHRARLLGLSLADIREILALSEGRGCLSRQPEYQQILKKHVRDIDQRIGRGRVCSSSRCDHDCCRARHSASMDTLPSLISPQAARERRKEAA